MLVSQPCNGPTIVPMSPRIRGSEAMNCEIESERAWATTSTMTTKTTTIAL